MTARCYDKSFRYTRSEATGVPLSLKKNQKPLIGLRFGQLCVLSEAGFKAQKRLVNVSCDCGRTKTVRASALISGNTKSCGCACLKKPRHGHAKKKNQSRTYRIWTNMRARCAGQISPANYRDKGISVCDRWLSFENFIADMGPVPPDMSIDRIDNSGPYSPDNCRWATNAQQRRNRSDVILITIDGETLCLKDWCHRFAAPYSRSRYRIVNLKIDPIVALTAPRSSRPFISLIKNSNI